ncbi:tRNA uridine-5-carboxymethylaminomethyl(34) synthesis GTPase MnmE [Sphingobium nicotianae]|uniref:tRNA modification GTPase MnmE n=1 Tax=Sphingobium nicotianae TaxID=2782607 RepID=A0A9X1IST2_9SPHN|nr:tRNA uridine-5-carboxymethylaminomethyl(34) synthesis GTPase MnmE [Sphingobium nicotianae]MBT2188579.1 tRNA uridine-5-carboxymethylaminomethyl(34) synthesis GTPase MnmE [Sphingobium nicotianae]
MSAPETSTIFALSSGQPPAAIAVVRLSGPAAMTAARALTTRDLPAPRQAAFRRFIDPATGETLDEGLLIIFPGPRTETGEDMAELHGHGSRAVLRGIETALERLPGLRLAEPGEFTRRAFVNGKTDLASIEGLGDLLAAETALQRRAAMAMMGGALSRKIELWTTGLRRLAAEVEARIDFSDEGDVEATSALTGFGDACVAIADDMDADLSKPSADRLRDGVRVAIGGPPNAGKSTLFNRLIGREGAIVSPIAGTTRDVIEASLAIRGIPMVIADTAGLRGATEDAIERVGMALAETLIAGADILLWLGEGRAAPETDARIIQVAAKADREKERRDGVSVSALTGQGMDELVEMLCDTAQSLLPMPGDYALSRRQRTALQRAAVSLRDAAGLEDDILIGECLRQALGALDELTGRATTDAVLDELFSGFCIGK